MEAWKPYLKPLDATRQKIVLAILKQAEKFIPHPERVMSYGVPAIKSNGVAIIAVAAHRHHVGIYPFGSKVVSHIQPKLKNADCTGGTLRFSYDDLPTEKQLKLIVEYKIRQL